MISKAAFKSIELLPEGEAPVFTTEVHRAMLWAGALSTFGFITQRELVAGGVKHLVYNEPWMIAGDRTSRAKTALNDLIQDKLVVNTTSDFNALRDQKSRKQQVSGFGLLVAIHSAQAAEEATDTHWLVRERARLVVATAEETYALLVERDTLPSPKEIPTL